MLEKTPESPLDSKEIKPVNLKGNQPWILIGRADAEAEASVFWSYDLNRQLIGKVPNAGKDWGQKEKRTSEDEIAGWHHQYNGHNLGQIPGDGEGQGCLACNSPWGHKELDRTGRLNNNDMMHNPTSGPYPKENKNSDVFMHVYSIIHNNPKLETTKEHSTYQRTNKMWNMYKM